MVDFKGPLAGLQVTLLRLWYTGVTLDGYSSLRAELGPAAGEDAPKRCSTLATR